MYCESSSSFRFRWSRSSSAEPPETSAFLICPFSAAMPLSSSFTCGTACSESASYCCSRAVSSPLAAMLNFLASWSAASRITLSEASLLPEVRFCICEIRLLSSLLSTSTVETSSELSAVVV